MYSDLEYFSASLLNLARIGEDAPWIFNFAMVVDDRIGSGDMGSDIGGPIRVTRGKVANFTLMCEILYGCLNLSVNDVSDIE